MSVPYIYFDNRLDLQPWFLAILDFIPSTQDVYIVSNAGGEIFNDRPNLHFIKISELDYKHTFHRFCEKYIHLSTHEPEFELSCFERFFAIESLMNLMGLESIWHLDTDVLPTSDLEIYDKYELVFSSPYPDNSVVSAHTSKFSLRGIRDFNEFLIDKFYVIHLQELINFYNLRVESGLLGGVCDMQGLAYWLRSYQQSDWLNSFGNVSERAKINHTIANLRNERSAQDDNPLFLISLFNRKLHVTAWLVKHRYATLHFQGQYKFLIPKLLKFGFLFGTSRFLLLQTKFIVKWNLLKNFYLTK